MMDALTLDYVKAAKPRAAIVGILIVAALSAACVAKAYADLNAEKKRLQGQSAELQQEQRRIQEKSASAEEKASLKPEIVRANDVVKELSVPWDGLFKAVETAHFEDVAVLSIQPDASRQSVAITAESKDMASMLEYIRRLSREEILISPQLTSHQIQQQDPQKPIRFMVTASWKFGT